MADEKKKYDLEDRTFNFAKNVRSFCKKLPNTIANEEDIRQLVRASGSVGANYIEANESFSKKDFIFRIKVCRKESKESRFFLRLVDTNDDNTMENDRDKLINEATEIMKIFGAIITKSEKGKS